ncbi:MAG: cytidylate kinase-like family protein [Bacillota bacterium]
MKPYVITISRQFGSLGRAIASELSLMLGINFYDRDIVEETSKRLGLPVSEISKKEEASKNKYHKRAYPLGIGVPKIQDEIFMVQRNIIEDLARKESCIIVGRCAESILAGNKRALHVYIYAPYMQRFKNCTEKLGMDEATAKKLIKEVDFSRNLYHKHYCPEVKNETSNHDIMLDSSKFGVTGTAEILAKLVQSMFILEEGNI